jgi:histone arginine demethylase JMJD6
MGPERSGSTVHIDPLLTAAWNTSLFGHKRWVLFPEHIPKSIVKGKKFRGKNYEDEAINYFTSIIPQII